MADGKYFSTTKKGESAAGDAHWALARAIEQAVAPAAVGIELACHAGPRRSAGEIHELKEELASLDRPKKKEAVKKVIAAMTVGKDVSMLFPAVVNCMQTEDLELKKLVYLYLINYAKTQPDLAIMAVNTFVKVRRTCGGGSSSEASATANGAARSHGRGSCTDGI